MVPEDAGPENRGPSYARNVDSVLGATTGWEYALLNRRRSLAHKILCKVPCKLEQEVASSEVAGSSYGMNAYMRRNSFSSTCGNSQVLSQNQ